MLEFRRDQHRAMATVIARPEVGAAPLVLRMEPIFRMDDDQFASFCALNDDLRIERTAEGDLVIMPPAFSRTGARNFQLTVQVGGWAASDGRGVGFDSSAGFRLPNSAIRGPDSSWVSNARLAQLTDQERDKFLPLCPDFVIELRSHSDRLRDVQAKMEEYIDNGAKLGWLIDPESDPHKVYVYRPGRTVEELTDPDTLSGDPELSGFVLDLKLIWEPGF